MMPNHLKEFPPPDEYIYYLLRKHIYHCTPSQLDQENWTDIQDDLAMIQAEEKFNKSKAKK